MKSINEQLNSLNSFIRIAEEQEKLSLPLLQIKLEQASQNYPEDFTIGMIKDVVKKMASKSNSKLFITRAELKDLYKNSYCRNNKFITVFAQEMGVSETAVEQKRADETPEINYNEVVSEHIDPVLAHNLAIQFGAEKDPYTKKSADAAINTCKECFSFWNIPVKEIKISAGDLNTIVCQCSFETPKGNSSVFVPVILENQKPSIPSVFVGNFGPEDFNSANVKNYIFTNAGIKLANVNANQVLQAIASINNEELSQVDLAITKLNSAKETNDEYFYNSITHQELDSEVKPLQEIQYFDPEMTSVAKSLEKPLGNAILTFGKEKVDRARKIIASKLNKAIKSNYQINVLDCDKNNVIFAVSMNEGRTSFRVPVKLADQFFDASVMIVNGSIKEFDSENITEALSSGHYDSKASIVNSTSSELSPFELVETVREAMAEDNLVKAEDALNVLAECGDPKAYQTAFAIFQDGLSNSVVKTAETKSCCSNVVKTATSQHLVCGHTGLPIHKVYQDAYGNCRPMYRKAMDETSQGAIFVNHKVFI